MPNGAAHRTLAAITVGGLLVRKDFLEDQETPKPMIGAALAGIFGTLPDKLEPAYLTPHHRQFFHSVTFGVAIGWYGWQLLNWQPKNHWEDTLRLVLLAGCGAYLSHLAADALTRRSLPLLGKISM